MGKLSKKLREAQGGILMFQCPGCDMLHGLRVIGRAGVVADGAGPRWSWNSDVDRPTFQPSVLVTWDQWEPPATNPEISEQIRRGEVQQRKVAKVCHSFVTDGRIQFLGDCTHALRGQTVDLPDLID